MEKYPVVDRMTEQVSVVTRTKNRPLLLERAICSVLSQTFEDWHHYIVNDGGNANEVESLVQKYYAQYRNRVTVFHNPSSYGMEAASTIAINNSQGEFIVIHDDDDSWHEAFLQVTVAALKVHAPDPKTAGIVTHARVIVEEIRDGKIKQLDEHLFRPEQTTLSYFKMLAENCFPPICFLFRRSALEAVGGFDTGFPVLGDWEFNLRIMRHFNLVVISQALANYHHRPIADNLYSNSVYAGNSLHKNYWEILVDNQLRQDLDEGKISISHALILANLHQSFVKLTEPLNQIKSDLAWEFRQHTQWLNDSLLAELNNLVKNLVISQNSLIESMKNDLKAELLQELKSQIQKSENI